MRALQILINSHHVATLSDNAGVWSLEYTPAWIARPDGYDLSPALPRAKGLLVDGSSERPVQWFFDNLLPEEQARTLLASDAKLEFADAFGLLSYYGSESAGAITLLPEPQLEQASGLKPISDAQLSERIRNLPRVAMTTGAPKRMSLAGAQHKLPIVMEKDALFEWKPEGVRTHADITRASVISLGEAIGVRAPLGNKIIDELVPGVEDAARDLLEKNAHAWHAGESRLVRRIVHGVIRDMTEKLRP